MIYLAAFAAIYFLAGGAWRTLGELAGGGVLFAGLFIWRNPYAWKRITGLFHPEADPFGSGWHIRQFELAIAAATTSVRSSAARSGATPICRSPTTTPLSQR